MSLGQANVRTVKLGDSADTSKNFLITTPLTPDGSLAIQRENGSQILTMDSAGKIAFPFGQLAFPSAQNASADPNTLDDYEEGTWTPTLNNFGGTGLVATGRYIKIGRMIFFNMSVVGTNVTQSPGYFTLPFTAQFGSAGSWTNDTAGQGNAIYIQPSALAFCIGAMTAGSAFYASGCYLVAD